MSRLFQEPANRPPVVNCAQCKNFNKGDCTISGAVVSSRPWRQCADFKDKRDAKHGGFGSRRRKGDRNGR